jgi:hypothetical protein
MKKKRFEVRCPAIWSDVDSFQENTYDESVKIEKGKGFCDNPNTAERLRKFGYTVIDSESKEK